MYLLNAAMTETTSNRETERKQLKDAILLWHHLAHTYYTDVRGNRACVSSVQAVRGRRCISYTGYSYSRPIVNARYTWLPNLLIRIGLQRTYSVAYKRKT